MYSLYRYYVLLCYCSLHPVASIVRHKVAHVRTVCRDCINNLYQVGVLEESSTVTDITLPSSMDPPVRQLWRGGVVKLSKPFFGLGVEKGWRVIGLMAGYYGALRCRTRFTVQ